jgi:site-specific DNA-methyltransferase (adenine-specific)
MTIEKIGNATLYLGDCREILPSIEKPFGILSDPPYGIGLATDYAERFTVKGSAWWKNGDRHTQARHQKIVGDDEPFDPSHLLALEVPTILWGGNCFASRLPDSGGWFVWDKRGGARNVSSANWPMGEGEIAWTNTGKGVRIFRHTWFGLIRDSERGEHYHPTQKPVQLMGWCLGFLKPELVLDPYMGSGTTGLACVELNRPFIGIEIDQKHFDTACRRISEAHRSAPRLFQELVPSPEQGGLL